MTPSGIEHMAFRLVVQCLNQLLQSVPRQFRDFIYYMYSKLDRLCGLVVRVSGYRYRGLGFDSRRYKIFCVVVGLERSLLSLVRSIEELLE